MHPGLIPCGTDGKCGGKDGALGDGPTMNNTLIKLACMSGLSKLNPIRHPKIKVKKIFPLTRLRLHRLKQ